MQAAQQHKQHKHRFTTRMIKELKVEAQEKMKGKKLTMTDEKNEECENSGSPRCAIFTRKLSGFRILILI